MTTTISDVVLTGTAYQDVYAATSIVLGTPLIVQNKSASTIFLQIKATIPDNSNRDGYVLFPQQSALVENATEGLWAFGNGHMHVEQSV